MDAPGLAPACPGSPPGACEGDGCDGHGPDAARVRQAAHPDTGPHTLRLLAAHPSPYVRGAVALNPATQDATNAVLAADSDPRVRELLARKLAALCPLAAPGELSLLHGAAARLLGQLVRDEAVRVRAAAADVVKDMPDAPRGLVLLLARDPEPCVCGPVIALSPLLTAEDLLSLLGESALPAHRLAVARRPALASGVCDALARSGDAPAIAALLANPTAALRESTLESLVAKAGAYPEWQAPLVRRPVLSARVAGALSRIVADDLLRELAARADLPPSLAETIRARLAARLEPPPLDGPAPGMTAREALAAAKALRARGELTERALFRAAEHGDPMVASAMLAVAADMPLGAVERAWRLRSAKGAVSLVWKAGFSMLAAEPVQFRLARVAPVDMLRPDAHGRPPLAIEEMRFQLDFLAEPVL